MCLYDIEDLNESLNGRKKSHLVHMNIWQKVIDDIDEIYFLKKDNQNKIKNYFP